MPCFSVPQASLPGSSKAVLGTSLPALSLDTTQGVLERPSSALIPLTSVYDVLTCLELPRLEAESCHSPPEGR